MKRSLWWAAFGPVLVLGVAGCGESEADRKHREQVAQRGAAHRAVQSSGMLRQAQVTNAIGPAMEAAEANDQVALAAAVADLKELGAPAVERLRDMTSKGKKADRLAAITILGEMGADAAASTLEGIVKDEADAEIKDAAIKALAKVHPR